MGLISPPARKKADPANQQNYNKIVQQAVKFLLSENILPGIAKMAEKSPGQAIAMAVSQAMDGVSQAAQGAGVGLQKSTQLAAAREVAMVLANVLASAGYIKDAKAATQEALQMLAQGMKGA